MIYQYSLVKLLGVEYVAKSLHWLEAANPSIRNFMTNTSLSVTGAKIWNLLHKNIKSKPSMDSFKASLTTFIMMIPDNPHVPGIASQNSFIFATLLAYNTTAWNSSVDSLVGGLEDDALPDVQS